VSLTVVFCCYPVTFNQVVAGSIPARPTNKNKVLWMFVSSVSGFSATAGKGSGSEPPERVMEGETLGYHTLRMDFVKFVKSHTVCRPRVPSAARFSLVVDKDE